MKIILAPDSFKGSITAGEASAVMARALRRNFPRAEVLELPVSDGGEGLVEALVTATGGEIVNTRVTGPLGNQVDSCWGLLGDRETAVVEMAAASGLSLVPETKRNPMFTTTSGTGELIKEALEGGCRKIIVGIGGSATNDGGVGMARALGIKFLGSDGEEIQPHGGELLHLERIDDAGKNPLLEDVEIQVACDVSNPLTGPCGAARVYAPQKGATEEMLPVLEEGLKRYAGVIRKDLGMEVENVPGAGAAGGMGAGLIAFLGAGLQPGIDIVLDAVCFREKLENCHLVITGEGKLDGQSIYGKAPVGVARVAAQYGVPVAAVAGQVPGNMEVVEKLYHEGITACFSLVNAPMNLEEALEQVKDLLETAVVQVVRLWQAAGNR